MNSGQRFTKAERISHQREIDRLFGEGRSFVAYPIRVIYLETKPLSGAKTAVLISVPKKRFKRAVHRNRIKRLIRETYRLNKNQLPEVPGESPAGRLIGFIYLGNELPGFATVEAAMQKAFKKIP